MLDENLKDYMINKMEREAAKVKRQPKVKNDLSMEEAAKIYLEIFKIFEDHAVSYVCARNLLIALTEEFITGEAELYNRSVIM